MSHPIGKIVLWGICCSHGYSQVRFLVGLPPIILNFAVTVWIAYNIRSEMKHYVQVRQEYLVSEAHSSSAQACSVLVTGIPPKYLSELSLTRLFNHLPGGVRHVWVNRDLKDMPDLYQRRLKACDLLESAETSLLNIAVKRNRKKLKRAEEAGEKEKSSADDPEAPPKALLEELVPKKKRPSHRLPLFSWMPFTIPFVGKNVDTIEWAREQVHDLTTKLDERREILAQDIARTSAEEAQTTVRRHNIGAGMLSIALPSVPVSIPLVGTVKAVDFSEQTYPPANAAFILFNKQLAAHIAAQMLTHNEPYTMSASQKYIEVAPEDVIWENLAMNNYDRRLRSTLSWAATFGLILVLSVPGQSCPTQIDDVEADLVFQ
jgi:calcium permeable stress-gated cation channel